MNVFCPAAGLSGGSIAGIVAGSLSGLAILVIVPICICACVVYNSRKTTITHVPRTTTVTQPQSSHTYVRPAATTNFTVTTPKTFTVEPPPSYGISYQYPTVGSSMAPQMAPPYNPHQQPFDQNVMLPSAQYPTLPPNPYPYLY